MGFIEKVQGILGFTSTGTGPSFTDSYALATPYSVSSLAPISLGGWGGAEPVTVADALKVPAVSRGIQLYMSAISQYELEEVLPDGSTQPFMATSSGDLDTAMGPASAALRNAFTVQDILFSRHTLLAVERDAEGYVVDGMHVPLDRWEPDEHGNIMLRKYGGGAVDIDQESIVYIPSLMRMGFLEAGSDFVRQYLNICRTISERASNPTPLINLQMQTDFEAVEGEAKQAQEDWVTARRDPNGSVAITPASMRVETPGADQDDSAMLLGARNAARVDAANLLNMPASILEGDSGTNDDYSNTLQTANEFVRLSVALPCAAIEARLSQNDVTRPGHKVRFNTSAFEGFEPAKGNAGTATATPTTETQGDA